MAGKIAILDGKENNLNREQALEIQVMRYLREIGIPSNIKGHNYLKSAIIMVINDRKLLEAITKELYPEVAKEYGTTPSRVERAMRHAIVCAWERGDKEFIDSVFGATINRNKARPTNSEFIATVSEEVRINQFDR